MNCIPEVIPSFLIASYREAGERFLKRSCDLNSSTFCASLVLLTSMRQCRHFAIDIVLRQRPLFFERGDEKSGKKLFAKAKKLKYIVRRHEKKKIKSLQTSR